MDEVIGEDGEISYAMNRQLQTELAKAMQKAKDRLPEPGDDYYYISWNWEENGEFNGTYRYFVFKKENCRKRSRAILIKLADNRIIEQ